MKKRLSEIREALRSWRDLPKRAVHAELRLEAQRARIQLLEKQMASLRRALAVPPK